MLSVILILLEFNSIRQSGWPSHVIQAEILRTNLMNTELVGLSNNYKMHELLTGTLRMVMGF